MPRNLRDLTRDFGRGDTTLETLRGAARAEPSDRHLAGAILNVITDWENSGWTDSVASRNQLRLRIKQLVPATPPPAEPKNRRPPGESMYDAGLRGQRRRS